MPTDNPIDLESIQTTTLSASSSPVLLSLEELNALRQRVLAGEDISDSEVALVVQTYARERGDLVRASAKKKAPAKRSKKPLPDLNDLLEL